ncbi:MAG: beta-propeller fold lactonase family protein [Terriglobales bacterium]
MSKKIMGVVVLVGTCALSVLLLSCGSSSSRPTGVLYVETQGITDQGTPSVGFNVTSYAINLNNGSLSIINNNATTCTTPASQTNNAPCGAPLDIFLDPTGATAFVLNQGIPCIFNVQLQQCIPTSQGPATPPSIVNYTVNSDGSLSAPIAENYYTCLSPTLSGTCTPPAGTGYDTAVAMTHDAAGQFLFVIDEGVYPQPPTCPLVAAPADADHAAKYVGCPSISVFSVTPGKTALTLVSQSSTYQSPLFLSKIPTGLSTITFTPGSPANAPPEEVLFVTDNYDLCTVSCLAPGQTVGGPQPPVDNALSVYVVSSTGVLTEQSNSPYNIPVTNPVSVFAVNTAQTEPNVGGVFAYVGNGAQAGAVTPFQLCTVQNTTCSAQDVTGNLVVPVVCPPQQSCAASAGQNPIAMVVDPTNNFLYVLSSGGSAAVYGFSINETAGTLTPLPTPSQPTGAEPVGLALQPSIGNLGQYLYVSNSNSANITGFTLSTANGTMSSPTTIQTPPGPTGIALH